MVVTLDPGLYNVSDIGYPSVSEALSAVITQFPAISSIVGPIPTFSGDCTQTGAASFSATGDIAAGGQETCNIVNNFVIKEEDEEEFTASTADSHITAQGTTDSSELTALEKITKLKQQ